VVSVLDGLRLAALVEVGGEAEAALGVLDDAAELAPAPQRLLGRVLALDAPEVLLQVALHPPPPAGSANPGPGGNGPVAGDALGGCPGGGGRGGWGSVVWCGDQ